EGDDQDRFCPPTRRTAQFRGFALEHGREGAGTLDRRPRPAGRAACRSGNAGRCGDQRPAVGDRRVRSADHRDPAADRPRSPLDRGGDPHRDRPRADGRPCRRDRQDRVGYRRRAAAEAARRHPPNGGNRAGDAHRQHLGLHRQRRRGGAGGRSARRPGRRVLQPDLPGTADLYDGRPLDHQPSHPPALGRPQYRADRRPLDERLRAGHLRGHRRDDRSERRHTL
ncbi:MAG: Phosphate transport system regulatory protein PhoU, partial [uncultured Thermomicrobiales bacterium]